MRTSCERRLRSRGRAAVILALLLTIPAAGPLHAHCDTLDGPVVAAARTALEAADPTPVLRWVAAEHEADVRSAFERTLTVRDQGPEARELADRWFFETLVRLHRQGEGYPYTGLQPEGATVEPVILAADAALASGSADELARHLSEAVARGVRERFEAALEASRHADESVEAGRRFVAAYVELTHTVEALDALAAGRGGAHGGTSEPVHAHGE